MAKIFVLDTNIILHDHQAIKRFQENDLVIPIAVIEELDKFKKGNDALAFNARAFMRDINKLTGKRNLRLKAKAVGMPAQDYQAGRVDDEHLYDLEREVMYMDADPQVIQQLAYGQDNSVDWKEIAQKEPKPNQLYKFDLGGTTVCARYNDQRKKVVLVRTKEAYGIRPRNDEQRFALDACLNPAIPLVSLTGGAGTGKTLIALAAALEQEKDFDQIILSRPTVVLGGQDIGFLPGDQRSKMSPYVQPLMDNLDVIKRCFKLLISPLAYIRGRSLGKVYFIVDEAQNLTPHEVKTIITRAGEGTKMVFTGDIFQIDQPYLDQWSNGLTHLGEKMNGQPLFQHIFLRKGERSELSDIAAKLL